MKRLQFSALTTMMLLISSSWAESPEAPGLVTEQAGPIEDLQGLQPLADAGNAIAQFNLGVMYDVGRGVRQDYAQAVHWYRLAAAQGHAAAQFNLGGCKRTRGSELADAWG